MDNICIYIQLFYDRTSLPYVGRGAGGSSRMGSAGGAAYLYFAGYRVRYDRSGGHHGGSLPLGQGIAMVVISVVLTLISGLIPASAAAKKDPVGKRAVWLIANAEKVSSFCNDIVGDICGVVSGASAATIAVVLFSGLGYETAFWLTLSLTALVSSVTVGGKALGKKAGIDKNREITLLCAKILSVFSKKQGKKK